ncbi:MAG: adenylosuccinate lyase [Chloroflexi bacterium]|nr:adenylosuccinate lyase [Chloroflexota bacterium]
MIERYARPAMRDLWTTENKYRQWLRVEILVCEALALLGQIPPSAAERIRANARFRPERIAELETDLRHDVLAFLTDVGESLGDDARYLHLGLTSSDIVDTAQAVLLAQATDMLVDGASRLVAVLKGQALRYKDTPMIGRTHGVHAEPITLGLKFALWAFEMDRNRRRLAQAREAVAVGKISGAVGTYATVDPFVEEYVCGKLGLRAEPVSSQIVPRDRYAELLAAIAITGASLEKFATEVRHLQRTEVMEAAEPFGERQKGSSAMPHKRNPVQAEQICGLARVLRGYLTTALDNIALWHERDISHSSAERIILPGATSLLDYMLDRMCALLGDLEVFPENMARNLALSRGLFASQRVMLALVEKGMSREDAYALVQGAAMDAWRQGQEFRQALEDRGVSRYLSAEDLDTLFDLTFYRRNLEVIFRRLEAL